MIKFSKSSNDTPRRCENTSVFEILHLAKYKVISNIFVIFYRVKIETSIENCKLKIENCFAPFSLSKRGFTLVELMVTTSIFVIITLVVLINYPRANGAIALRLMASELAVTIREAQVYGVSVRGISSGTDTLFPDYGMYFGKPTGDANVPYPYYLFADKPVGQARGDGIYDPTNSSCGGGTSNASSECITSYGLKGINTVLKICGQVASSNVSIDRASCYNDTGALTLENLTVLFRRPNPEAILSGHRLSDNNTHQKMIAAGILIGRQGETDPERMKMVLIWNTGQITVK
ncbi:MAG: hypothetical protein COV07_03340 [Candidatus Vogelbacteria bacterium CG10_big_fil_rev_8_21_14_0_10_45_14]|uniref:Uncharacterized protein n=1 Tax=Candidatus Vogelbacteria bacterium CG10_big_fil_rev_8_21_14_0_10_45_14 TaxID=1975042 RepID=A0A2H0RJ84_9BACT|nr:MAG: hypothetical protein COV07_03340 [Candidatus Vogelbacteria bacterium CG10_big_fil_rev_8_21_14_0_10_45_14]